MSKQDRVAIRCLGTQAEKWKDAASKENRSLSSWICLTLDAACIPKSNWEDYNKAHGDASRALSESLQSPPIPSVVAIDQFTADSRVGIPTISKRPEKPKGHGVKCSCVKCQQAKGWRG